MDAAGARLDRIVFVRNPASPDDARFTIGWSHDRPAAEHAAFTRALFADLDAERKSPSAGLATRSNVDRSCTTHAHTSVVGAVWTLVAAVVAVACLAPGADLFCIPFGGALLGHGPCVPHAPAGE